MHGRKGALSGPPGGEATKAGQTTHSSHLEAPEPTFCQLLASSLTIPFIPSWVPAMEPAAQSQPPGTPGS